MRPAVSSSLCAAAGGVKSAAMIAAMAASAARAAIEARRVVWVIVWLFRLAAARGAGSWDGAQSVGGVACPSLFHPQHSIAPPVRIAQVFVRPTATAM